MARSGLGGHSSDRRGARHDARRVAAAELQDSEVALSPGDVLLRDTDGVTESRTPDGFFGPDRLAAALQATLGADAATVARDIAAAVSDAAGARITDDVALLVIQPQRSATP